MNNQSSISKPIPTEFKWFDNRQSDDPMDFYVNGDAAPGWQWQKNEKGATTLWEYWNGSASHNHVIHGGDFPAWWAKYSKKARK